MVANKRWWYEYWCSKGFELSEWLLLELQSNGFQNVIATPTLVTLPTASVLDKFITNSNANNIFAGVIDSYISYHLPIFCMLQRNSALKQNEWPELAYREISFFTLETFRDKVTQTDRQEMLNRRKQQMLRLISEPYLRNISLSPSHIL